MSGQQKIMHTPSKDRLELTCPRWLLSNNLYPIPQYPTRIYVPAPTYCRTADEHLTQCHKQHMTHADEQDTLWAEQAQRIDMRCKHTLRACRRMP